MEVEKRFLEPVSGFSGELGVYLGSFEEFRNRLRKTVSDLTTQELTIRVFPKAHQIGNLLLHLGESEAGWIWQNVAGKDLGEEEKRFVHWCDTTERDYAEKAYSAKECLERIDKISEISRRILMKFTDADLDKIFRLQTRRRHRSRGHSALGSGAFARPRFCSSRTNPDAQTNFARR